MNEHDNCGRAVMIDKPAFLRNEKIAGLEPLEASARQLGLG